MMKTRETFSQFNGFVCKQTHLCPLSLSLSLPRCFYSPAGKSVESVFSHGAEWTWTHRITPPTCHMSLNILQTERAQHPGEEKTSFSRRVSRSTRFAPNGRKIRQLGGNTHTLAHAKFAFNVHHTHSAPEKIYLYNCPRGCVVPVFHIHDCVINWICTVLANHHPINNVYVLIIKRMVYTIHIDKTHTLRQNEHTHAHAQNVYPTLLQSMFSCAFMFISVQNTHA